MFVLSFRMNRRLFGRYRIGKKVRENILGLENKLSKGIELRNKEFIREM